LVATDELVVGSATPVISCGPPRRVGGFVELSVSKTSSIGPSLAICNPSPSVLILTALNSNLSTFSFARVPTLVKADSNTVSPNFVLFNISTPSAL